MRIIGVDHNTGPYHYLQFDRQHMHRPLNILILCTGNSARSLLGEALFNHYAQGRWRAFSAGSQPKRAPHPMALQTLQAHGIATTDLRSKSWDEFAGANAPQMDVVITVCDNAANEVCPLWRGAPFKVHWGMPDPAATPPATIGYAFETTYQTLSKRIARFDQQNATPLETAQWQAALQALATVN